MRASSRIGLFALCLAGVAPACTESPATTDASKRADAVLDAPLADASPDIAAPPRDASDDRADAPVDAPADAAVDAPVDAPADAVVDRVTTDVADDAPRDVALVDAPADVPADTAPACDGGACATTQRSCAGGTVPGCGVVRVAGGTFTMGVPLDCRASGAPQSTCVYDGAPEQPNVTVGPFTMDAYEVTVARFRAFWRARAADDGASLRARPVRYPDLDGTTRQETAWGTTPGAEPVTQTSSSPCNWSREPSSRDAHPINCLTWWTAQEFCVWDRGEGSVGTLANGRLPTEAEWEFAARGRSVAAEGLTPGRTWPWGAGEADGDETTPCTRAQWNRCVGDDGALTRRVGSFAATGGLFDLAGNVDEWTADLATAFMAGTSSDPCVHRAGRRDPLCQSASTVNRVLRGGSFLSFRSAFLRAAARAYNGPGYGVSVIGFRCVSTTPG